MTETERDGGGGRGKWLFWIVKINKHVWAYSSQHENLTMRIFPGTVPAADERQSHFKHMRRNISFIFPHYGRSKLLGSNSWGGATSLFFFSRGKSYTNALSICCTHSWWLYNTSLHVACGATSGQPCCTLYKHKYGQISRTLGWNWRCSLSVQTVGKCGPSR